MAASPVLAESHRAIAPVRHTVIVLFALIGLGLAVTYSETLPFVGAYGKGARYVWIILFEWVIVGFICFGVRAGGMSLRDLIGGSWARAAGRDPS